MLQRLILVAVASCLAAVADAQAAGTEFVYQMSDGEHFTFRADDQKVDIILADTDLVFEGDVCTTAQLRCADITFGVVAVPRGDIAAAAPWQIHGWTFEVDKPVETRWGRGWSILGTGPKEVEAFTYVPGVGLTELQLLTTDRPGWKKSTPISLVGSRGLLADD